MDFAETEVDVRPQAPEVETINRNDRASRSRAPLPSQAQDLQGEAQRVNVPVEIDSGETATEGRQQVPETDGEHGDAPADDPQPAQAETSATRVRRERDEALAEAGVFELAKAFDEAGIERLDTLALLDVEDFMGEMERAATVPALRLRFRIGHKASLRRLWKAQQAFAGSGQGAGGGMPSERQIIGDGQGDGDANASAASKSARAQKRDRQKAQAQQKQAVAVASPEEDPNAGVHSQERLPSVAELLGQEPTACFAICKRATRGRSEPSSAAGFAGIAEAVSVERAKRGRRKRAVV